MLLRRAVAMSGLWDHDVGDHPGFHGALYSRRDHRLRQPTWMLSATSGGHC